MNSESRLYLKKKDEQRTTTVSEKKKMNSEPRLYLKKKKKRRAMAVINLIEWLMGGSMIIMMSVASAGPSHRP